MAIDLSKVKFDDMDGFSKDASPDTFTQQPETQPVSTAPADTGPSLPRSTLKVDAGTLASLEGSPEGLDSATKARSTMAEAVKEDPNTAAQDLKLSRKAGLPVSAVKGHTSELQQKLKVSGVNWDSMAGTNPETTKFLSDYDNASQAHDEVGLLARLENIFNAKRTFKDVGSSIYEGFKNQVRGAAIAVLDSIPTSFAELFGSETALSKVKADPSMSLSEFESAWNQQMMADEARRRMGNPDDNALTQIKNEWIASLVEQVKTSNKRVAESTPEDLNLLEQGVRGGVESLANMVPGLALTLLSGGRATPMLATMGAQTFGQSYGDARAQGLTTQQSMAKASMDAGIEVGTEMLPTGVLERMLTGKSKGLTKDALKFVAKEMSTEQVATFLQSVNDYGFGLDEQLSKADSIGEAVAVQAQRQAVTAIATAVSGGAMAGFAASTRHAIDSVSKKTQEEQAKLNIDLNNLDQVNEVASQSKLRNERDAEVFHQFIKQTALDQNVFIDRERVSEYLKEFSTEQVVEDLGLNSLKAGLDATEANAAVQITMPDFATYLAGTQHYSALRESVSTSADTPSLNHARAQQEADTTYLEGLVNKAEENVSSYLEAREVFEDVKQQLVDSGAVSADLAGPMSDVATSYFTQFAAQNDLTVSEAYELAGLKIEGPKSGLTESLTEENDSLGQDNVVKKGYYSPSKTLIRMTEAADATTFIHEFGHFSLDMERRFETQRVQHINDWYLRQSEDVAREATEYMEDESVTEADVATYLKDGTTGNETTDAALNRATHEQFARAFEQYLMDNKAPSKSLRDVFRRLAHVMAEAYRSMRTKLSNNLDEGMRKVFDRMLASEEQIKAAEARARFEPLFKDAESAGKTKEEFAEYKEQVDATHNTATEKLRNRLIKELTRQQKSQWKAERSDIVREQIDALASKKVYVTRATLKSGENKLDLNAVRAMVGEQAVSVKGKKFIRVPAKFRGLTATGGKGVHPDQMASMLGYDSGAQMLRDLATAPTIEVVARRNADEEMIRRHGDILNDGTIEEMADDLLENEQKAKLLLNELKSIKGTRASTIAEDSVKAIARERIDAIPYNRLFPEKYRRAEIRAAQETRSALDRGDRESAAQHKLEQLMNHYLVRYSTEARANIDKTLTYVGRYRTKKVQAEIVRAGQDYWDQITRILERFEFRKSATLRQVEARNEAIQTWAERLNEQEGTGLTLSAAVLDGGYQTHWKNVPYAELMGIRDSIKNIEFVARNSNKIKTMGEEIDFKTLVNNWTDHIHELPTEFKVQRTDAIRGHKKVRRAIHGAVAQMTKVPFLASWLDGGDRAGMSQKILMQPLTDAFSAEMKLWDETGSPVRNMIRDRSKADLVRHNTKYFIPEIQDQDNDGNLYGHQILAVAANTGNESNLRKLLLGEGWADPKDESTQTFDNPKLQAVLAKMTKTDWEMVQAIWDQMDLLYPKLAEVHKRTTGLTPPKIQSTERTVITSDGETVNLKGGYYPMKYDPNRSSRAEENELRRNAEVDSMFNSQVSIQASVNASATEERTGYYAPVNLTLDVIPGHFQETIHYITHHEAVRDINRLIKNDKVKKAIKNTMGPAEYAQLRPWLNRVAKAGRALEPRHFWDPILRRLRFGVTIGTMGFNAATGIKQLYGLAGTAAEVGSARTLQSTVYVYKNFTEAMDLASKQSKIMEFRAVSMDREIQNAMRGLADKSGILARAQEVSMKHIALIQTYMVDLPTWFAAYDKGLADWGDEARAIRYADWAVENIQGSGSIKDMSTTMSTQNEGYRMLTMFMTYMSSLWNMNRDVARGARKGYYSPSTVAAKAMFLLVAPVLLESLTNGDLSEPDDGDEDERLSKTLASLALYPVQTMPFVRDLASGALGDYGYNYSPVAQLLGQGIPSSVKLLSAPFTDAEITRSNAKNVFRFGGAVLGVPGTSQAWRTGESMAEFMETSDTEEFRRMIFGGHR